MKRKLDTKPAVNQPGIAAFFGGGSASKVSPTEKKQQIVRKPGSSIIDINVRKCGSKFSVACMYV